MRTVLADEALDRIFRIARTYNGYRDVPVEESLLREIWDLMKWGPTSANMMPARLLWLTSQEQKDKLADFASSTNGKKIRQAPVTVVIGMDMRFYDQLPLLFPHADARSWFVGNQRLIEEGAFRNSSLQGAYFIIAARALGLDTGPMSGFDNDAVDDAFFRGTDIRSNFISTLGYGDPATIFERLPRPSFEAFNTIL